jgi:hypothetical protein
MKGFLKNSGNVLKSQLNTKALRSKVQDFVFVYPRKLYLKRDGKIITQPDGLNERPIRIRDRSGERVALVRSDYINQGSEIEFELELVENAEVTFGMLNALLQYGSRSGLGQFRNGGYGTFDFESVG